MADLVEIIRENIGKSSYQMRQFFQDLIKKEELKAYFVELNKEIVEKNTEDEIVVKTIKGAILTPTTKLEEYQAVFVEDPTSKIMYNLDIGCRGGMFFDDGDSQTMYHHCTLERLAKEFNPKKVATKKGYGEFGSFNDGISIPREMITARLSISYDQDEYCDNVTATRGHLVIEGEQDNLFTKVYHFVKNGSSRSV
jgi:hypothetical protein